MLVLALLAGALVATLAVPRALAPVPAPTVGPIPGMPNTGG
jgi:hypothetical protein